jgi:hypothetical protein
MKASDIRRGGPEPEEPDDNQSEDQPIEIREVTAWDKIKTVFPEHMQDDPKVARAAGWLAGYGTGTIVEQLLRNFFRKQ